MEDNDCKTNKQFGEFVGVSAPVITRAVNYGIIPTTAILLKIADRLNLSLAYLLTLSDENEFFGSPSPVTFHIRIKELANERNETFGAIASKMPFMRTYFYDWIKSNMLPSMEYAIMIAEYFDVSLDYLFGRTDYRK